MGFKNSERPILKTIFRVYLMKKHSYYFSQRGQNLKKDGIDLQNHMTIYLATPIPLFVNVWYT